MSDLGVPRSDAASHPAGARAALRVSEQAVERIDKPSARLQPRSRVAFNKQAWWAVLLVAVGVISIATALGFQRVHNNNTVVVFGQVTEQAPMAWYYDHPWFGALVLAGLPALAFAWLIVTLLETRHRAAELQTDVADLTLQLQHIGYRLQGQLDQIAAQLERKDQIP